MAAQNEIRDMVPITQIFNGHTAWFSESVSQELICSWSEHGGKLASEPDADFLFSEDPADPDTKCLFNSQAFLEDCLSIFHPLFIECCVNAGAMDAVILGNFYLPSSEVYFMIKDTHKFRWEEIAKSPNKTPLRAHPKSHEKRRKSEQVPQPSSVLEPETRAEDTGMEGEIEVPAGIMRSYPGYIKVEDLPKIGHELFDFTPGVNGCDIYRSSK